MFNMKTTATLLTLLSAVANVSAHGYLAKFTAGGKTYTSPRPGSNGANKSPIRSVSSPNPNYGTDNAAITCGPNSKAGSGVADVNPGDVMTFDWEGANGSNWPHNTGPMITYMASCGDRSCAEVTNPANLKWFKIAADSVGKNGNWPQGDLMKGAVAKATVPQELAPGNYMVRHEIIALHLATQRRMAEFYPGCVAIRVGGNGKGVPQGNFATFPGTYKDSDPGIFVPNLYDGKAYAMPGPKIATFAAGSGNTTPPAPAPAPPTTPPKDDKPPKDNSKPPATGGSNTGSGTTPKPSGSSNTCGGKKKKRAARALANADSEEAIVKPRYHSRVMKRLIVDLADSSSH